MERIVTAAQMQQAEERAEGAGVSEEQLMHNAGSGAAQIIAEAITRSGAEAHILVLCGPGNNGGDGLVVANQLAEWDYSVAAYTFRRQETAQAQPLIVRYVDDPDLITLRRMLQNATMVVDALLGTGRSRPIDGDLARIIDLVHEVAQDRVVVALDLPSGVNADSGAADPHTIPATITVTFGFVKRGLVLGQGAALAGHIMPVEIGLPSEAAVDVPLWRVDEEDVRSRIPVRLPNANKYTAGAVLVVAGSRHFTGAPQLATLAATRAGAGLVTLATGASTHPLLAAHLLEPTFLVLEDDESGALNVDAALTALRDAADHYKALLIGPGLARAEATVQLVEAIVCGPDLPESLPIVVDAEGLNALAKIDHWWQHQRHKLVLTPHSGEMSRLCDLPSAEVESRRFDIALERAQAWDAVVVLKGNPTVTANPEGQAAVNATGGPNLASGGTGDVLGGIITALIAQGAAPFDAAVAAVYLHGRAGDELAKRYGDRGTLAGDLLPMIPRVIKDVLGSG